MIHHFSIPARDPARVAQVLADLMGGRAYRFPGPLPGAAMAVSGDRHGTMIEIYPETVVMAPGDGEAPVAYRNTLAKRSHAGFHVLLSVPHDRATIERIGQAAGWRTKFFSRAAPGLPPVFHVVEVWVENRLLLEVVPADMIEIYESYMQIGRMDTLDLSLDPQLSQADKIWEERTMSGEIAAEVLIVGAGPTGLSLAITLRRWGIPVRIIDRNAQPTSVSKALALWSASLEALQGMGVVDRFVAEGQRLNALCVGEGDRRLATLAVGEGIDSAFPFPLLLPQSRTEALLTERLAELGVSIERNVELVGLTQDASGVTATLRHAEGRNETVRTKYLAGCDGARSAVRQTLDITFEGYTEPQTFLLADVKIDGGNLDHRSIYLWWHNGGTVAMFPFGNEVWRIFSMRGEDSPKGDEPATLEEMQHCVDRFGPRGLRIHDPSWLSIFRINERLVTKYRVGRCFLAGDAAHIHSPAGGQGMNTGIQDAVNLGWKLSYALNGAGNTEVLLDSYEAERRPIARAVIAAAAQKQHLSFGASKLTSMVRNMAVSIFGNLPAVHRKLQVELSETEFVYRDGPLVALAGGKRRGKRTEVGTRAREASIIDAASGKSTSLWPYLSAARHSLLIFEEEGKPIDLNGAVQDAGDRLQVLRLDGRCDPNGEVRERYRMRNPGWVLVRPDQVVAARGAGTDFSALLVYAAQILCPRPDA